MIPQQHRDFVEKILDRPRRARSCPTRRAHARAARLDGRDRDAAGRGRARARQGASCIANALGTPPADVIDEIHAVGPPRRRAVRRAEAGAQPQGRRRRHHHRAGHRGRRPHRRRRLDRAVARGDRRGRADAGARRRRHRQRPADGRRARAWARRACGPGSLWLTVEEADVPPAQMERYLAATSRDTVRSRSWTGKPCRMLRNDWTDAWERPGHTRAARHAAAVHGHVRRGAARPPVPRAGQGR